jgi:hypothetical protein
MAFANPPAAFHAAPGAGKVDGSGGAEPADGVVGPLMEAPVLKPRELELAHSPPHTAYRASRGSRIEVISQLLPYTDRERPPPTGSPLAGEPSHDQQKLHRLPRPKLAQGKAVEKLNGPSSAAQSVPSRELAQGGVSGGIVRYEEGPPPQLPAYLYQALRRPAAIGFTREVWSLIPTLPAFDAGESKTRLLSYTQLATFLPGTKWQGLLFNAI